MSGFRCIASMYLVRRPLLLLKLLQFHCQISTSWFVGLVGVRILWLVVVPIAASVFCVGTVRV